MAIFSETTQEKNIRSLYLSSSSPPPDCEASSYIIPETPQGMRGGVGRREGSRGEVGGGKEGQLSQELAVCPPSAG